MSIFFNLEEFEEGEDRRDRKADLENLLYLVALDSFNYNTFIVNFMLQPASFLVPSALILWKKT
jgi:hypothetical protein